MKFSNFFNGKGKTESQVTNKLNKNHRKNTIFKDRIHCVVIGYNIFIILGNFQLYVVVRMSIVITFNGLDGIGF